MERKEELFETIKECYLELKEYDEVSFLNITNLDRVNGSDEFIIAHATAEEIASYGLHFLLDMIGRTAEEDGKTLTEDEKLLALRALIDQQLQ